MKTPGPMSDAELSSLIEQAFTDRQLLGREDVKKAVETVIARLDAGTLRVASPEAPGRSVAPPGLGAR